MRGIAAKLSCNGKVYRNDWKVYTRFSGVSHARTSTHPVRFQTSLERHTETSVLKIWYLSAGPQQVFSLDASVAGAHESVAARGSLLAEAPLIGLLRCTS